MGFDYRCPFCRSENIKIENNTETTWGNDLQGLVSEDWKCESCNRTFATSSVVEVISRSLELIIACPYCGDSDELKMVPDDDPSKECYGCESCNRLFWIRPEEYYQGNQEAKQ